MIHTLLEIIALSKENHNNKLYYICIILLLLLRFNPIAYIMGVVGMFISMEDKGFRIIFYGISVCLYLFFFALLQCSNPVNHILKVFLEGRIPRELMLYDFSGGSKDV